MRTPLVATLSLAVLFVSHFSALTTSCLWAQSVSDYFEQQVQNIERTTASDLAAVTKANWEATRAQWRSELVEMLGIPKDLQKTDLAVSVVGSLQAEGIRVDRLHYQSRPGLYVAGNLYKPVGDPPADGWPAILYVCGHARVTDAGRLLGNKTGYQHHGVWFARHGFVCLMIDTVQLGEFHGEHHGTYKLGRWDWISRGYTPAGVEAWNAVRGVDLLCDLPYVDRNRIGITGRSGGGAYSWFAAALDERIAAAVPVAGITDLRNHVLDGCVEGHCDCMYFINYHRWDYGKLAALIAPRALLLENSDTDGIFPLDGVVRVDAQLRSLYSRLDAAEQYGLVITPGPHKDTQDLRVPAFRFFMKHLQGITDPVVDAPAVKEFAPKDLAVFERETPKDERVTSVSTWFSDRARPDHGGNPLERWQQSWLPELRRIHAITEAKELPKLGGPARAKWNTHDVALWSDASGLQILRLDYDHQDAAASASVDLVLSGRHWSSPEAAAEAIQSRLEGASSKVQYFVRWSGADWRSTAPGTVKKQTQVVRRFYLIGETPEQVALKEWMAAIRWIAKNENADGDNSLGSQRAKRLTIKGDQRSALLAILASLIETEPSAQTPIDELQLGRVPKDLQLTACLPGLAGVCTVDDLLAAARLRLEVVEQPASEAVAADYLVDSSPEPQQATGMRIVEVGPTTVKIWARATRWPLPNLGDLPEVQFAVKAGRKSHDALLPELGADGLRYGVPGVKAEVRAGIRRGGNGYEYSPWKTVSQASDYSALAEFDNLSPGRTYSVRTQVRAIGDGNTIHTLSGSFRTLPQQDQPTHFRLAVSTCQAFIDRDGPHGFDLYRTALARQTDAFVMAGDVVYYDRLARSRPLAHYHWQRTYSLPTLVDFHRQMPVYFLKDDHDTYVNDSWPGQEFEWTDDFKFEAGQEIFQQQTGLPTPAYRTFLIGNDLQVWMMEGRDYRSPNSDQDGPLKTIWGTEQKEWLERTLAASQAKFKVVISPTPLVGPDRDNKKDNHANQVFANEGNTIRQLLASFPNTVSVCGDRHWQFHSIDPETGLHEFSVGPASDRHAGGWKQEDFRPDIHQYLRVAGGYLELELRGTDERQLVLRHLDTHGNEHHRYTLE